MAIGQSPHGSGRSVLQQPAERSTGCIFKLNPAHSPLIVTRTPKLALENGRLAAARKKVELKFYKIITHRTGAPKFLEQNPRSGRIGLTNLSEIGWTRRTGLSGHLCYACRKPCRTHKKSPPIKGGRAIS
jgi:hypothetical protein